MLMHSLVVSAYFCFSKNNNKNNVYVKDYILNGQKLSHPEVKFKDVVAGGKLEVTMDSVATDKY